MFNVNDLITVYYKHKLQVFQQINPKIETWKTNIQREMIGVMLILFIKITPIWKSTTSRCKFCTKWHIYLRFITDYDNFPSLNPLILLFVWFFSRTIRIFSGGSPPDIEYSVKFRFLMYITRLYSLKIPEAQLGMYYKPSSFELLHTPNLQPPPLPLSFPANTHDALILPTAVIIPCEYSVPISPG